MKHLEQTSIEEIGKLVQSERKRQGMTQSQLAGLANTGVRFVSDLENGKGTIQVQKLLSIVQTLGLGLYIFSPYENEGLTAGKIVRTFERADIGEKVVRDSIARQIDRVTKSLPSQLSEASRIHPSSVYAEIADSITQRIRQLAFGNIFGFPVDFQSAILDFDKESKGPSIALRLGREGLLTEYSFWSLDEGREWLIKAEGSGFAFPTPTLGCASKSVEGLKGGKVERLGLRSRWDA